jgi:hypothetical protein
VLAAYLLVAFVLSRTAWGTHVYAVGDDRDAATCRAASARRWPSRGRRRSARKSAGGDDHADVAHHDRGRGDHDRRDDGYITRRPRLGTVVVSETATNIADLVRALVAEGVQGLTLEPSSSQYVPRRSWS